MTMEPSPNASERVARLAAYFQQNRDRFTTEALKQSAAEAGYEAAEIELAWSRIAWGDPERAAGRARTQPGVTAVVAIVYVLGTWFGAIGLTFNSRTAGLVAPGFLAALLGGVLVWAALREQAPSVARGIAIGIVLAIVLPVVFVLVFIGICLATGSMAWPLQP
jgi:hypothetical protein